MKQMFTDRVGSMLFDGYLVGSAEEVTEHVVRNFTELEGLFTFALPDQHDWINEGKGLIASCGPEFQKACGVPAVFELPLSQAQRRDLAMTVSFSNYRDASAILSHVIRNELIKNNDKLQPLQSNMGIVAFAMVAFNEQRTSFYFSANEA